MSRVSKKLRGGSVENQQEQEQGKQEEKRTQEDTEAAIIRILNEYMEKYPDNLTNLYVLVNKNIINTIDKPKPTPTQYGGKRRSKRSSKKSTKSRSRKSSKRSARK